jgi:hypothetical protein
MICFAARPLFCPKLKALAPVASKIALAIFGTTENISPTARDFISVIFSWCSLGITKL